MAHVFQCKRARRSDAIVYGRESVACVSYIYIPDDARVYIGLSRCTTVTSLRLFVSNTYRRNGPRINGSRRSSYVRKTFCTTTQNEHRHTCVCVYIRRFSFNVHGIRKLCPGSTGRADVGPYIVIRSLHGRSRGIAIFVRIVVVYTPPGAENLYSPTIVAFPSPFICFFPGTLFSRVRPVISSRENERQI